MNRRGQSTSLQGNGWYLFIFLWKLYLIFKGPQTVWLSWWDSLKSECLPIVSCSSCWIPVGFPPMKSRRCKFECLIDSTPLPSRNSVQQRSRHSFLNRFLLLNRRNASGALPVCFVAQFFLSLSRPISRDWWRSLFFFYEPQMLFSAFLRAFRSIFTSAARDEKERRRGMFTREH